MSKTAEEVQQDFVDRFKSKTGQTIQEGSTLDLVSLTTSELMTDAYTEIENNKNPHIFTRLTGDDLDANGFFVNCPREVGENDKTYLYRQMEWLQSAEASNDAAIQNALLNMEFASNVKYIPFTKGTGTGSAYIIPKTYDADTIQKAIDETKVKIAKVASKSLYVQYIIPQIRGVRLMIYLVSKTGDSEAIKTNLSSAISTYVNGIAPGEYLEVGAINKIGITAPKVDFFNVAGVYINEEEIKDVEIMQEVESKFLFDEIIWLGGN